MFDTSARTLKQLAALVWLIGVVVLFLKSSTLFIAAERVNPGHPWIWLAIVGGLILGSIKAKYLFNRLCQKNLRRIDALAEPKIWQFYRIHFFIFLFTMITLGASLSRLAQGDYPMLLVVAFVELSVGTALLGSIHCFKKG